VFVVALAFDDPFERATATPASGSDPVLPTGRYIITLEDGVHPETGTALLAIQGGFDVDHLYRRALSGFSARLTPAEVTVLATHPAVRYVEPDRIVSIDAETLPTGIDRIDIGPPGDINGTTPDLDIDIAVIDTGIQPDHPDLRVSGGFASYGFVFFIFEFCGETDSFADGHGHGTHVAGTAAAKDNDQGVVGVAPGARLWAVRVLGPEGTGCLSDVIAGVDWVTENAATIEVANMSIESEDSPSLCTAMANSVAAGVVYAVAAGNSGINAQNTTPANCADVIAVSAVADYNGAPGGGAAPTCQNLGADDTLAVFSNYGAVVDMAAPGVCIISTWLGGGYNTISGTSMASPHVAGGVARFILDEGYSGSSDGPAVLAAMAAAGWTEPQNGACGFGGDPDGIPEPMLHPGDVCEPGPPAPSPTSTSTPTVTATASHTPSPTWTPGGPTMTPSHTPSPTNTSTITPTLTPTPTAIPMTAQGISAGGAHACALTSAGGVRCWGLNFWGELGDGTNANRNAPVDVVGLSSGVTAISTGGDHTCALLSSGGVSCWGRNDFGQLGDGTTIGRNTPGMVPGMSSGVAAISAGGLHTCALMSDATVKCWGRNDRGQLGDGTNVHRSSPVTVAGLGSVMQIDTGGSDDQGGSTCARTNSGGAKCWGRNDFGQLGDGTTADRFTPVDVSSLTTGVDSVGVGRYHSCARMAAGGVKCWGWNIGGQLGDGGNSTSSVPVDVVNLGGGTAALSVGGMHTCALLTSSGVRCWGYNTAGQIGDGTSGNNRQSPVDVLQAPSGAPYTGFTAIAAGGPLSIDAHTCGITETNTVCWGQNGSGEVGDGTNSVRTTPVEVVGTQVPADANPGP
jgi:alpha-tubulin suppressor-like RCC1 family protein